MAIMKTAALSIALALALSSNAFAILRPRFPRPPVPPSSARVIIVAEDDSLPTPRSNPSR
jgi:hypothetical protein